MLAQLVSNLNLLDQEYAGAYEAPPTRAPSEGDSWGGGFNITSSSWQSITFYIALHCTRSPKLKD